MNILDSLIGEAQAKATPQQPQDQDYFQGIRQTDAMALAGHVTNPLDMVKQKQKQVKAIYDVKSNDLKAKEYAMKSHQAKQDLLSVIDVPDGVQQEVVPNDVVQAEMLRQQTAPSEADIMLDRILASQKK